MLKLASFVHYVLASRPVGSGIISSRGCDELVFFNVIPTDIKNFKFKNTSKIEISTISIHFQGFSRPSSLLSGVGSHQWSDSLLESNAFKNFTIFSQISYYILKLRATPIATIRQTVRR